MSDIGTIDPHPHYRPPQEIPQWAVVRFFRFGGKEIAWFFKEKDAREYISWKSSKSSKRSRH